MRLHRHDELVGALKERLWSQLLCQFELDHEECEELAAAALDALLEAAVRLEVGFISQIDGVGGPYCRLVLPLTKEASDDA